jgi:hypothetical protein
MEGVDGTERYARPALRPLLLTVVVAAWGRALLSSSVPGEQLSKKTLEIRGRERPWTVIRGDIPSGNLATTGAVDGMGWPVGKGYAMDQSAIEGVAD